MSERFGQSLSLETEINLQYLQAELARIDVFVRRTVHCWQVAGKDPLDAFRGLAISDEDARQVSALPFGANWGQTVTLSPDEERDFQNSLDIAQDQANGCIEKAKNHGLVLRLKELMRIFTLSRFEFDAFLVCLAPSLDLRYERLYAYLQDDVTRKQPTLNLLLTLLGGMGPERLNTIAAFTDDSPLFKYHLIDRYDAPDTPSLLGQALRVDPSITSWLLGRYQPPTALKSAAHISPPQISDVDLLLTTHSVENLDLASLIRGADEKAAVFAFYGPDRSGQQAAAHLIAGKQDLNLLQVDLAKVIWVAGESPVEALRLALRDARLTGAIPYLIGWDTCLGQSTDTNQSEQGAGQSSPERTSVQELLAELFAFDGLVIVAGQRAWQAAGIERDRPVFFLEFPVPAFSERRALWEYFLQRISPGLLEDRLEITALAGQFALNGGQIRDAVNSARDLALQENRAMAVHDLYSAARVHSSTYLGGLARKIEPRYTWQDIILPADQLSMLREIVMTVRGRPVVLDEWGVGEKLVASSGIPILFSGSPGTGKTMAAEVIANELELDLYKIELSTVVSKYIGETEKNLEAIFNEAEASNAILFFDEADAIFGKRSEVKDAHDRYANIEISYLLQRMERYNGVTILATNLRANLDDAFTRRLQFSVDFPFPDEEHRLRIWRTLFPPDVPREVDLNLELMARRFKLAGGNIRNILVNAAYLAAGDGGSVTMSHLLHGARRELQKMGRLVNEADMVKE